MLGRIRHSTNASSHFVVAGKQETPIEIGASIKVKMHDNWLRGRFEVDRTTDSESPLLNAGDKKFVIPEGSEIELVFKR